jgi:hypothetical protein
MMKNIRSRLLRITKIQKSHQVALLGNKSVKHRLGWSRRKCNSSQNGLSTVANFDISQMMNLNMHGNPVFPIIIKKLPSSKGNTAA